MALMLCFDRRRISVHLIEAAIPPTLSSATNAFYIIPAALESVTAQSSK